MIISKLVTPGILHDFMSIIINESWIWDDLGLSKHEEPNWTFQDATL